MGKAKKLLADFHILRDEILARNGRFMAGESPSNFESESSITILRGENEVNLSEENFIEACVLYCERQRTSDVRDAIIRVAITINYGVKIRDIDRLVQLIHNRIIALYYGSDN